jgi:hypothetical protein
MKGSMPRRPARQWLDGLLAVRITQSLNHRCLYCALDDHHRKGVDIAHHRTMNSGSDGREIRMLPPKREVHREELESLACSTRPFSDFPRTDHRSLRCSSGSGLINSFQQGATAVSLWH